MKKRWLWLGAGGIAVAVVIAVSCRITGRTDTAVGEAAMAVSVPSAVSLLPSFVIADGASISHTPAVVYTSDRRHTIAATSRNEVVVFDVATQKMVRQLKLPDEGTDGVWIDPAGRYAAWALKKGGLAVMELESGKIVATSDAKAKWVAISPGGDRLAVAHGNGVELLALPSLSARGGAGAHEAEVTNLAWSADGRLVASTAKDGRLVLWDVEARRKVREIKKDQELHAVAFHPSGRRIAYGGHDKKVYEFDLEAEGEEVVSASQPYWITCLGYSPDGESLAAGDESCDIWLFRVKTKELAFHGKHHVECWLSGVSWAPDNETFLFSCRPNAHAGKPSVYWGNAIAEAALSEAVQKSRAELLRHIEDQLEEAQEPRQRESLMSLRQQLSSSGVPVSADPWGYGLSNTSSFHTLMPFGSNPLALGAPSASLAADQDVVIRLLQETPGASSGTLENLPSELRESARKYHEILNKECERLKSSYRLNQWKVKK